MFRNSTYQHRLGVMTKDSRPTSDESKTGKREVPYSSVGLNRSHFIPGSKKIEPPPQVNITNEEDIIVIDNKKKTKWVWNGSGTSQKTIESLSWMLNYREPIHKKEGEEEDDSDEDDHEKGKKMKKKQIDESYDNFDDWFKKVIKDETKKMREIQNKKLDDS